MRKVIIDCDPGHDDIMAIMTALAHDSELELLSFCTVAGNQTVEKVTENILKVEEYLDCDIPVYKGCDRPMVKLPKPQPQAHGESGLDGPVLRLKNKKAENLSAVEYYKEVLSKEDKVTIVALAPLTNLAYLLKQAPELSAKIEQICLMGGALKGGNINKYGEFNIWHDPEAAKIVFDSNVEIIMAPIEVCNAGGIYISETKRFRNKGKASQLVSDLLDYYCRYAIDRGWDQTAIFDLIPILYLLDPDLFTKARGIVEVITEGEDHQGQTVFKQGDGNVTVLLDADREGCMKI